MSGKHLIIGIALLAAAACTVEPVRPEALPEGKTFVLEASLDAAMTKVSFDDLKLNWEPDDEILVTSDSHFIGNSKFTNISETPGKTARFQGPEMDEPDNFFYAVYPYGSERFFDGDGNLRFSFKDEQRVPAGGVDKSHLVLYGKGRDRLEFTPQVGLLKFVVEDATDAYTVYLTSPEGRDVYTNYYDNNIELSLDGQISIYGGSGQSKEITVKPEEGLFVPGEPYYVAFLPGELHGLVITVSTGRGKVIRHSDNTLKVEAGKVYSLGSFSAKEVSNKVPDFINSKNGLSITATWGEEHALGLAVDASFDIAAHTEIYPWDAPQERKYVSLDENLEVSPEGIVTATAPTVGAIRVISAVNPAVYEDYWLNFSGFRKDGVWYLLMQQDQTAIVTNKEFGDICAGDYSGTVTVPATIEFGGTEYAVRRIGLWAFSDSAELVEVKLPEGIWTIDIGAFSNCPKLEHLNIPYSVDSMPNVNSNELCEDCPNLSITSDNTRFTVDEYGNLYDWDELIWLCEKTAPVNAIREGTVGVGSGSGNLYNSMAKSLKFPVSMQYDIWVNSFRGKFPNLEEIVVDWTSYDDFNRVFKYYKKDSSEYVAGLFSRLRGRSEPIRLSVPAGCLTEYADAVADYGFSEVVTH